VAILPEIEILPNLGFMRLVVMRLSISKWFAIGLAFAFAVVGFGLSALALGDNSRQHQPLGTGMRRATGAQQAAHNAGLGQASVPESDQSLEPQAQFGVSGGNVDDETAQFCCSGTLGALVTDGSRMFVLSNNHVLARSNRGRPGEDIVQPGLIDTNCNPGAVVAHLTFAPPLGDLNVDAAIAEVVPGTMDTSGSISGIGSISSVPRSPSIGLSVEKSGRTTGVTTGTIQAINAAVSVVYHKKCVPGKRFSVNYDNQVIIGPGSFSDSGDSGALIVTADGCHQPVGMLVGGGTNNTSANPIGDVLSALQVSVVGSSATCGGFEFSGGQVVAAESLVRANSVAIRHKAHLMSTRGIVAVGIGASAEQPGEAAIVIYVDQAVVPAPPLPTAIEGIPVRIELTDQIVAR
jgi:hypothetical protein